LLALILIVFGVGMFAIARWTLVNSVDDALWGTVQQIVQNMTATRYGEFGGPVSIRISVPEIDVFRASGVHVQVWQAGSRGFTLLRTSSNLGGYAQPIDPVSLEREGRRVFENNDEVGGLSSDVNINGTQWRVLTRPLNLWGIRVIMQAAMPLDTVNQASRGLLAILAFSLVFALLGSMAVGFSLSNRALKPIDAITQAASRIASTDDLSTRLPWSGPMDELGRMISVFNL